MLSNPRDLKSEISSRPCIIAGTTGPTATLVANSAVPLSTNQAANLLGIDRRGESTWPSSGGTGGPVSCDLAASAVFDQIVWAGANTPVLTSCTTVIQNASDNATWSSYVPPTNAGTGSNPGSLVAGTAQGLSTQLGNTVLGATGVINMGVDLTTAKRYIRSNPTPTFSGGSSTIYIESHCILGGFGDVPVQTPTNP